MPLPADATAACSVEMAATVRRPACLIKFGEKPSMATLAEKATRSISVETVSANALSGTIRRFIHFSCKLAKSYLVKI